jgi:PAS domain S-box-containing protein
MVNISILIIEDSEADYKQILGEIVKSGYNFHPVMVRSETDLRDIIRSKPWDVAVLNCSLTECDGIRAMKIIHEHDPDLPCIVILGHAREEIIVDVMQSGAEDFIIKGHFSRLMPAINRSLRSSRIKRKKKIADKLLIESRENIAAILNVSDSFFIIMNADGIILEANDALSHYLHVDRKDLSGKSIFRYLPPMDMEKVDRFIDRINREKQSIQFESNIDGDYFDIRIYPVFGRKGLVERVIVHAENISDRWMMEMSLRESEERFRSFVEQASLGFALVDDDGTFIEWNKALEMITGYSRDEMLGKTAWEMQGLFSVDPKMSQEMINQARAQFVHLFQHGSAPFLNRVVEARVRDRNGNVRSIEQLSFVVVTSKGVQLGTTFRDVTSRMRAQELIQLNEERMESLLALSALDGEDAADIVGYALSKGVTLTESSSGYVFEMDANGYFRLPAQACYPLLENDPFEKCFLLSGFLTRVAQGKIPVTINDDSIHTAVELPFGHVIGCPVIIEEKVTAVVVVASKNKQYNESDLRQLVLLIDGVTRIVMKKRAEQELRNSLHEKEVLLKEIHHRVKNNLQIISSLIHLQEKNIKDKRDIEVFRDSKDRIRSMALVHESLYQSDNLAMVNFGVYVKKIVDNLVSTYLSSEDRIQIKVCVGDLTLAIDTAIPCGLLVNEFLTNALKYAFPVERKGDVNLSLEKMDSRFVLAVADNGIGLPDNFSIEKQETLGMTLIRNLVNQLQGELLIKNENGVCFQIFFPQ